MMNLVRAARVNPLALAAVLLVACRRLSCQDLSDAGPERVGEHRGRRDERRLGAATADAPKGVLYADPARPPFGVVQYSPVYYRVCAGFAKLAGVEAGDAAGVTVLARSVSLACLLGQVFIAGVILRRHLAAGWDLVVSAGVCLLIVQGVWG